MDPTVDSSPLKRFAVFWLGLATFCLFGLLALVVNKATGGDKDPGYDARARERNDIREKAEAEQAKKLAEAPVDISAAAGALSGKKAIASAKPVPGTKAFDDWMAAQAAATTPGTGGEDVDVPAGAYKLTIEALPGGVMKFKQTELAVKPGAEVVLTFVNPDVMQHNWLLLKPGTIEKVGALADAMAADPEGPSKHYIPQSDDILANTELVNTSSKATITFTAPNEPGDYPYVCTFPGHWRLMQGVLKVSEDAPAPTSGGGDTPPAAAAAELKIEALPGGVMKFKQTELTVKAGAEVKLTFTNPDVLPHNFVLLKPGTKDKVGALADAMLTDPEAMKKGYIPETDDILAHSKLLQPAQSEVLEFTAPAEAGDYPYICTFPGHWRLMFGNLKVTP